MPSQHLTHFVVVGAGAAGLMTARELARANKRVTIVEARDRCGEQAQAAAGKSVSSSVEPGGGIHSVMIRQASECERYAPPFRRLGRAPRDRRAIAPRSWSPRR